MPVDVLILWTDPTLAWPDRHAIFASELDAAVPEPGSCIWIYMYGMELI